MSKINDGEGDKEKGDILRISDDSNERGEKRCSKLLVFASIMIPISLVLMTFLDQ